MKKKKKTSENLNSEMGGAQIQGHFLFLTTTKQAETWTIGKKRIRGLRLKKISREQNHRNALIRTREVARRAREREREGTREKWDKKRRKSWN